jgi:hypothetical protein
MAMKIAMKMGMKLTAVLTLLPMLAGQLFAADSETLTPAADVRPPDQTFLTYPEWYLVFSPAEYADYVSAKPPGNFPFMGHVGQFWASYAAVYTEIKDRFAFNTGYHVMVMVIGTSTTVEYAFRAAYEKVIGRLSELTSSDAFTEEDRLAAEVARDYVDFLNTAPWYDYDFGRQLRRLWTETGYWGDNNIRKWERKYALTTEYALKYVYAGLIKRGTQANYAAPSLETLVVADSAPPAVLQRFPDISVRDTFDDGSVLLSLPRYDPFKTRAQALAVAGVEFTEIAGNSGDILLSTIVGADRPDWPPGVRVLFEQEVMTVPGTSRVGLVVPVTGLAATLRFMNAQGLPVEHVFDY